MPVLVLLPSFLLCLRGCAHLRGGGLLVLDLLISFALCLRDCVLLSLRGSWWIVLAAFCVCEVCICCCFTGGTVDIHVLWVLASMCGILFVVHGRAPRLHGRFLAL